MPARARGFGSFSYLPAGVLPQTTQRYRTLPAERFLLLGFFVMLPLQDDIPSVGGLSVLWLQFALTALYVILYRPKSLTRVLQHPLSLALGSLLFIGALIESLHPNINFVTAASSYGELLRIAEMVAGALLVATLCRDRAALLACMSGYIVAALWLSTLLMLTSYSSLEAVTATNFAEASSIREQVFAEQPLQANLNGMAFYSAQGVVIAMIFAIKSKSVYKRILFLCLTAFFLVATFVPLSRGGILIAIITALVVLFKYKGKRLRIVVVTVVLGGSLLAWAPQVAISRLTFSTESNQGKVEGRARVLTAAVAHFPEYVMIGIGSGNFWKTWGKNHGFGSYASTSGAHNCFLQVMIYWGLFGIAAIILIIWQAYHSLPARCGEDALKLFVYGISISVLLLMLVVHNLYAKEFALGLGILIGSHYWIWPAERKILLRHHIRPPYFN
jgi:hypothetical protein